ncbi:MAG: IclR family transcriptional regulator [Clostridia bacterium]|nr:IclR family transcriptional regulator [Clostridia bacterium]
MNKSIARAGQILDFFAETGRPAGISEIARLLDIPKSSASDCLYSLAEAGYLRIDDPARKTFALGQASARLGYAAMREYGVVRLARPELEKLCRKFGQTVFLAVPEGDRVTVMDKTEPPGRVQLILRVGDRFDMHMTAAGKAMLAAMSDEAVGDLLGTGCYAVHTSASIPTYSQLCRELAAIRERGWAAENFEENSSIYGIAAPIYDCCDRVAAAISVPILKSDLPSCDIDAIAGAVMSASLRVSATLQSTKTTAY